MDKVFVGSKHLDLELVALFKSETDARQLGNHFRREQSAAILDGEDQMIMHIVNAVPPTL